MDVPAIIMSPEVMKSNLNSRHCKIGLIVARFGFPNDGQNRVVTPQPKFFQVVFSGGCIAQATLYIVYV